ncbi:hypothetical protein, conserved [Eimeria praecox]|uniref:Uncharacterized protein n=1 Tax=Eimeria praecox TaxID=51316 RepID=U6H3D6_9EIME|nr:hypothetical protein, conserved [Eimeria praecox]
MGPGRGTLLEAETLCGIPAGFPSMPLASESTEADENSPDPHRNSVSPRSFLPVKASMSVPFRETTEETDFSISRGKYQEESWRGYKDRHLGSCYLRNNGFEAIRHRSSPRASDLDGRSAEHGSTGQRVHSPVSSEHTSDSSSKVSPPQISSGVSDGHESDDGVAVYIDETEDDDTNDGLFITECRINSRKAAEIRAFKAHWVEQMMLKKEQLLSPCIAKGVTGGKRLTSSARKAANGHETGTASPSGSGAGFLESKLRAFAACMMPEALECISRNSKRWAETTSDTSDSDSGESPLPSSRCPRRRHLNASPIGRPSFDRRPHTPTSPTPTSPRASKPARELQQHMAHSKEDQQRAADAALHSWGRFLKYIRKTSGVLPSRQRIERKAGLESDDDDEQAPLYMCRPGSVQRPSPLISHSLTEHLKASGTMFFKQFRRQCLSSSASSNPDASGTAPTQLQRPFALRGNSVSASGAAHESPASGSATATVNDDKRNSHAEQDGEEAVPLYEISAETSALFGDMMRLEDTARMLDASCTFRLPAAPSSIVRPKDWKPKTGVEAAQPRNSVSAFSSSVGLFSAAAAGSPSTATTAAAPASQHRRTGHLTLYTSPHAATAAALSQLIVNCQAEKSLEVHTRQHMRCSAAADVSSLKPRESYSDSKAQEGNNSCVVYTVQADEDTLALSGLDAEYCARVEAASRGRNRAADSLALLERLQPIGNALQGNVSRAVAHKKKRKAPVDNNVMSSDDGDSGSERSPREEEAPGAACAEEANHQRSLMVDKLMLAHLMPYLPQFGPP